MAKSTFSRKDWIDVKRKYIYTDLSYDQLAKNVGMSRIGLMSGLKREFPNVDLQKRKREEKAKRNVAKLEKKEEKRVAKRLRINSAVDEMDERHLDIVNKALDMALESLENDTLRPKDIKDIKELINLERLISDKRTTNDRVIVVRAEKPDDINPLPEVIDGEFEVEDT